MKVTRGLNEKIISVISLCTLTILLIACGKSATQLENMKSQETSEYIEIIWGNRVYVPFCAINNNQRGKQIGIVDENKNDQVYEYKNYSTDEWIISFYESGEMDASMLMKEVNVTEIPNGLESEYEWNM